MIVGTAGHIDHGKTTLVHALTGVDTDRLKEEKARGISIELGYAYTPLPNGDTLGFIDVPGHERLIHTMAAGASGIDFGLLVVAADDGVMPQTREHLAILTLLGVTQGAVVISKADRVDNARIHQVQQQITALTGATFLQGMPAFTVSASAPDQPGINALRQHLHQTAQAMTARAAGGAFRLAVDRVFTLKGHGTVVTGTVHDGELTLNDTSVDLRLMPSGKPVRVRSLHTQNQPAESASAGQRCALNLAGIEKDQIGRGDWVADSRCFTPSQHIDVQLRLLPGTAQLGTWAPLHIHLGASHYLAHAVPLSATTLAPGETGWVQLVFDQPVCALPGDHYIARDAQARHTMGGGRVLDPNAPQRKRRSPERLAWLEAVNRLLDGQSLIGVLERAPWGLSKHEVQRLTRRNPDNLLTPEGAQWVMDNAGAATGHLILQSRWQQLADHTVNALGAFHQNHPDEPGLDAARLKRVAMPTMPEALWLALRDNLLASGRMQRSGPWLHQPGHRATLTEHETLLADKLMPLINAGAFDPPWVRDLAELHHEAEHDVRQLLLRLMRRGALYQVVRDLFYDPRQIARLARLIAETGGTQGVTAAQFRDATGLGRKRSIQLLEFFDRQGYTRRLQDRHVPRKDGAEFWQQLS